MIHNAVGGTADHLVIFCGSGATAAVNKLVGILELRLPDGLARRYRLLDQIPPAQRPVVFVGPYEHHSNELPWRETIADVVVIGKDADGHIDPADLSAQLPATRAAPAHRQLLGRLERHRHPVRRRRYRRAAARQRGTVVLGLRRGRPLRADPEQRESRPGAATTRTPCSCRRTSSSAAPRPLASWSCAVTWCATRCPPCRRRDRRVRRTRSATATSTTRSRGKKAAPRPSSSPSGPGWFRPQGGRRHRRDPGQRGSAVATRLAALAAQPEHRDPRPPRRTPAVHRVASASATVTGTCTTTTSWRCSTTCSASRPAAAAPARAPTATGCWQSTRTTRTPTATRSARLRGHQARLDQDQLPLLHLRHRRDYLIDAVRPARRPTATGCWPTTASTRTPASGATAPAPRPPLRLTDLHYAADGTLSCPGPHARAGEDALGEYLHQARDLLATRPEHIPHGPTGLPAEFEALRWFHLPPACLTRSDATP